MTNAGKTFTISGNDENPGLLPRALAYVFSSLAALDGGGATAAATGGARPPLTAATTAVLVSYLEIYNENCFDLLGTTVVHGGGGSAAAASARVPLKIKDGRCVRRSRARACRPLCCG